MINIEHSASLAPFSRVSLNQLFFEVWILLALIDGVFVALRGKESLKSVRLFGAMNLIVHALPRVSLGLECLVVIETLIKTELTAFTLSLAWLDAYRLQSRTRDLSRDLVSHSEVSIMLHRTNVVQQLLIMLARVRARCTKRQVLFLRLQAALFFLSRFFN